MLVERCKLGQFTVRGSIQLQVRSGLGAGSGAVQAPGLLPCAAAGGVGCGAQR